MRRIILIFISILFVFSICGCSSNPTKSVRKNTKQNAVSSAVKQNKPSEPQSNTEKKDHYPYDIGTDRKDFDFTKIDIVVGDNLYMTQINDWFTNFSDYEGKSVEIEGYYMTFDNYTFVGRKGPTCPYCTGGYVNFEFKSDDNLSGLISEKSWVKITGILRQGTMYNEESKKDEPFYYIEAIKCEKMAKTGRDTVTD